MASSGHVEISCDSKVTVDTQDPKVWGPGLWRKLHAAASGFNPARSLQFRLWIETFHQVIPCAECAHHFKEVVLLHPYMQIDALSMLSKKNVVLFFFWFHNVVNSKIGKPVVSFRSVQSQLRGSS